MLREKWSLHWQSPLVVLVTCGAAAVAASRPSATMIMLLLAILGVFLLLSRPILGFYALLGVATLSPLQLGTGTEVRINLATLMVPLLGGLCLLDMAARRHFTLAKSSANLPLFLFLVANLFSLLIGWAFWDPAVPRPGNLALVQLTQWAVFLFSAVAFWAAGAALNSEIKLGRLVFTFLALAGLLVVVRLLPDGYSLGVSYTSGIADRAPFWMLLTAVAGGQLLFNRELRPVMRLFLFLLVASAFVFAFRVQPERNSNWVGVGVVAATMLWLRYPRLRWIILPIVIVLAATGVLSDALYQFAGGDAKWNESGGSRLALAGRVLEVSLRNPITGLGPAAYRSYARMTPLYYQGAYFLTPAVNSHNNYVDLFAHSGLLGLGLFAWFSVRFLLVAIRLRKRYRTGFTAGYLNAAIAAWAGSLVLMALADWILPHVYNIGFLGFQISVLIWLFMGGVLALEQPDFVLVSEERYESADGRRCYS